MIDEWKKGAKYWDHAWNPVIGCKPVSEGCANCYAESMAERFPELQDDSGGFAPHTPKGEKRPPKHGVVFVGNMTDIFGEWNEDFLIDDWISMLSDHAINLILSKRSERLYDVLDYMQDCGYNPDAEHLWWGITAENQDRLTERAPHLMKAATLKRWISLEPLLGPLNIAPWLLTEYQKRGFDTQYIPPKHEWQYHDKFDWVVVGAESLGNKPGRECKIEWIEEIVESCLEYGVPVFVKQIHINGKLEKDIAKFPEDLQIRQVPWGIK